MFGLETSPLLDKLVESLEFSWLGEKEEENRCYPWIPLSTTQFLNGLYYCHREKPGGKYLCVGSGIGSKLLLAKLAGLDTTGIERRPDYIEKAKKLFDIAEVETKIIEADALDWDYGGYDFIYSYLPFVSEADEIALEKRIIATCDPKTVLFLPVTRYIHNQGWHELQKDIWVR